MKDDSPLTSRLESPAMMLLFPLGLLLLAIFFEYSGFDRWWVSHFYDPQQLLWPYQKHWLFKGVLHIRARQVVRIIGVLWLLGFMWINLKKEYRIYRKPFLYILCATIAGPAIIGIGKATTHISAPWDLTLFGGTHPYIRLFDVVPKYTPLGHAFPAGHASSGYGFFSIYFLLRHYGSAHRFKGFLGAILAGALLGLAQQIRGAHFPSHDLITIVICWYSALGMYGLFYRREKPVRTSLVG